ncbi:hydrolase [Beutenbergia cavernae DSM 12333]|uniref:Hydrolase n=1 Tax=Beutenbergia cavernae (strain ATCC BAA-8 / DSM 12333 / CCUG 43141 / JCM 11478 / NBRC 16432 / NCIMB 13614 / HKI 0122) TaxID=471853 RepID=C5C349_BEUC1|nr:hydrolase [Beutenbergia cavernae]ACQ79748.1 hydrolase [Beutenbergia cavernae DSM 12333]
MVWLELAPATFADVVWLRGESLTSGEASVAVVGPSRGRCCGGVECGGRRIETQADDDGAASPVIPVASPGLWSPDDPHLYDVVVERRSADGVDRVTSAVGLRRVEHGVDGLRLNGERIYVRGVLDQGYRPGSGITAPSDEALRRDIELA